MIFTSCEFIENRAVRHDGALSLQSVGEIIISKSKFEDILTNDDERKSTSANLLFSKYFSNPAFNHKDSDPTRNMQSIKIEGCEFINNCCSYDEFAIYVQCEEPKNQIWTD